jgi:hypothetical protein
MAPRFGQRRTWRWPLLPRLAGADKDSGRLRRRRETETASADEPDGGGDCERGYGMVGDYLIGPVILRRFDLEDKEKQSPYANESRNRVYGRAKPDGD